MPVYNNNYQSEKMNSAFGGARRRGAASPGIGNLVGDPFAFATVSISALGWLLCMVASVLCQIKAPVGQDGIFPKFIWWVVAFELMNIALVAWAIVQDVKTQYALAIVGYLSVGVGFMTLSINTLVFNQAGERIANGVGFILLSIVSLLWIFYFGVSGPTHEYPPPKDARYSTRPGTRPMSHNNFDRPRTTASGPNTQNLYTSAQLNGFETSSPVSGYPGGPTGAQDRNGSQTRFGGTNPHTPTAAKAGGEMMAGDVDLPTEYPYSAKAIYSYEANPDDANEISFTKHEILEVSDVSGRWWQARKENGEKGIAPSNYLILL